MNLNSALALLALGASLGIMIYFGAVIAPLVFRTLPAEHARPLIRAQFRSYYVALGGLCAFAAVMLIETRPLPGALSAATAVGFLILRQILMPQMDEARDGAQSDDPAAHLGFERLHRMSVVINVLQFTAIAAAAALLALRG